MADRAKFFADVPFVKAIGGDDPTDALTLKGYASTWTLDRDQEYVERTAFDGSLDRFLQKNPILLWQHDLKQPIGVVKSMDLDDNGLDVECFVPRPEEREPDWAHLAYNKIKSGIVRTFSIGGFFDRTTKGAQRAITKVDLFEVSVVSVPSNPDSIFAAAVKSLEGTGRPELTTAHTQQMAQLLGMKEVTDPEIAMMTEDEKSERYEFLAEIYRKTGKRPPALDAWKMVLDERGKPAPERLGKVLSVMSEVDGKEIAEVKQVAISGGEANQAVVDSVEAAEAALKDLETALADAGFDFGDDADDAGDDGATIQMSMVPMKAAEIRESVKSMREILAETRDSLEGSDEKRGRVLSRANENRLRKMRDDIDSVLAQLKEDEDDDEGKGAEVETPEDGDEDLDTKSKPTNLRAGDEDGQCSTCSHWRAQTGKAAAADDGMGFCKKFNFPTKANQVSDAYEAK